MLYSLRYLTVGSRLKNPFFFHSLCTNLSREATGFKHKFKTQIHQILHFLLEKCSSMRELKMIHAQIILHDLTKENLTLGKLVSFCAVADSGDLEYAQLVFDQIPEPNKFMYNSLIRGYSNTNDPIKAMSFYSQMISSGLLPNQFTVPFVLKACACRSACWEAVIIHGQAVKLGIGSHVYVQNALISVFVSCGFIQLAQQMFDEISDRTLVSWNSIIGGYSKMGLCGEAFLLFLEMRELSLEPDEFTFVKLLSACSQTNNVDLGRYVHLYMEITGTEVDLIVRNALLYMYAKCGYLQSAQRVFERMPEKDVVSWTSMVSAYAKHGLIDVAHELFNQMPVKNIVSWNSMISCCIREGQCKEALNLFHEMCNSSLVPDEDTLICVLSACSQIGDLKMGKKTHSYVDNIITMPSVTLFNSLIDMYAKCGALGVALDIFNNMPERNLVSWNVIIGGLALHGSGFEAVKLFEKMQVKGFMPDEITFTGLLSACSHSGFVDTGRYYFERLSSVFGVKHEIEHYACMVDLLGRGGLLEEAVRLVRGMPMKPDVVVWGALLGACRTHGSVKIGKQILKQILELEPYSSGLYVLLSNLFCEAERWDDVKNIRKLMNDWGIVKCTAISFIEIEGIVYEFMVDDKSNKILSDIHCMMDQLTDHLKYSEYSCSSLSAFMDLDEV